MGLIVTKKIIIFFPFDWSSNFSTQLSFLLFHTIVQHNFTAKFVHWIFNLILPTTFSTQSLPTFFNHSFHTIFPPNSSYQFFNTNSLKTFFYRNFHIILYQVFRQNILFSLTHNSCTHFVNLLFSLFCHTLWSLYTFIYKKKKLYFSLYAVYWITYTVYWVS